MFERYSEKARRVIFFARYEASQYGSRQIETEHILLGVMREGKTLMQSLLGPEVDSNQIRTEIEKGIVKRERFATSVEVPLSEESKKILILAAEEAQEHGNHYVGVEQLLLAVLRLDGSVAARVLKEQGIQLATIRERVANLPSPVSLEAKRRPKEDPVPILNAFLANLRSNEPGELALSFAKSAQVVNFNGFRCIGRDDIEKESKKLFIPYSKWGTTFRVESIRDCPGDTLICSVLWENIIPEGATSVSTHRMTILHAREGGSWTVFFLQVTPVVAA
jgi:hypothetical protein